MQDTKAFGLAMNKVVVAWENTMLHHLSNPSTNFHAFIGQCAVCYELGISSEITKKAWKELNSIEKNKANLEAQKAFLLWRKQPLGTLSNGEKDTTDKIFQTKSQTSYGVKCQVTGVLPFQF
jgi:hypothetical protein